MWTGTPVPRIEGVSISVARSLLFVPGDRNDRFDKAAASGADLVVCDLEDAVAPHAKPLARELVVGWLARHGLGCVRINSADSPWFEDDCSALVGLPGLLAVMVPKAENVEEITALSKTLGGGTPIIALIETALGVHRAFEIAEAPGVARLAFGAIDYALDIEACDEDFALLYARTSLVLMSRAARISAPIDGVTNRFDDPAAAKADAAKASRLGFSGKLCIHPKQVKEVNAAFTPSEEEALQANRVIESLRAGGVAQLDGKIVDKPIVDQARKVLLRVELFQRPDHHESNRS